jgi:hypothetical protein
VLGVGLRRVGEFPLRPADVANLPRTDRAPGRAVLHPHPRQHLGKPSRDFEHFGLASTADVKDPAFARIERCLERKSASPGHVSDVRQIHSLPTVTVDPKRASLLCGLDPARDEMPAPAR